MLAQLMDWYIKTNDLVKKKRNQWHWKSYDHQIKERDGSKGKWCLKTIKITTSRGNIWYYQKFDVAVPPISLCPKDSRDLNEPIDISYL